MRKVTRGTQGTAFVLKLVYQGREVVLRYMEDIYHLDFI